MSHLAAKREAGRTSKLANFENRPSLHLLPVARYAAQSLHPKPHMPEVLRPDVSHGPPACDANDEYSFGFFCTSQRMQKPRNPS